MAQNGNSAKSQHTQNCKPKMTSEDLIKKLKIEKGVKFEITNEQDAVKYIKNVNNYLRTAAYRKNYRKTPDGRYLCLDFAYLQELSKIDMYLRHIITQMCIDIEHYLKVSLLADLEMSPNEDGYTIVTDFLAQSQNNYITKNIIRNRASPFVGNLVDKYFVIEKKDNKDIITEINCPVWVFLEIITFGDFIKFYEFYYNKKIDKQPVQIKLLYLIKSLRNACAHNNCLIYDLSSEKNNHAPTIISNYCAKLKGIHTPSLNKKLKCRFIMEFSSLLYLYKKLISQKMKEKRLEEIKQLFFERIPKNKQYFKKNSLLMSSYFFLAKLIRDRYKNHLSNSKNS